MAKHKKDTINITTSDDAEVGAYREITHESKALGDSPPVPAQTEMVAIVDFGSQYSMLIARRVRASRVFCEVLSPYEKPATLAGHTLKGIILSGGPDSVYEAESLHLPAWILEAGVPILGICYGMQSLVHNFGGKVVGGQRREYGHAVLHLEPEEEPLFNGLDRDITVWMSHTDRIEELPEGFKTLASSENSPIAAVRAGNIYGLQFHPEVTHTPQGDQIISNFVHRICGCSGRWTTKNFIQDSIDRIRHRVGGGKVICALSGGVDSSVAAVLIHRAIGERLQCIFIDNGLLRQDEAERVHSILSGLGLKILFLDESEAFLSTLKNITDPEQKRIRIGETFIRIFERYAGMMPDVDYLAQGTLYPDVIESKTSENSVSHKIKAHHNVGGLPEHMTLKLVEPLRYLFKDEVRNVGANLNIPEVILQRHPFPGPGLAIRIIGEVTSRKLQILRACDWIVIDEIKKNGLYEHLWQAFAVLTNTQTVGVMGDRRTYRYLVAIRAVNSIDAMTADWARLPYDVLNKISTRIVNEVPEVNRVVYDVTSKPPGTIEWE